MFVLKRFLAAIAVCLVCISLISTAAADGAPGISPNEPGSQTSAEGINLQLVASANGDVVAIRIQECETCQPTTFLPSPNMEIVVGDKIVDVKAALSLRGRGGAVLYNSQNLSAEVVIFYGR
jgi:hypothetical protein